MAIEAFYASIYTSEEAIYDNRNLVMIEIVNLINNYEERALKQNIITHFFNYGPISSERVFYMDGIFQTIMSGEYNYNSEQVEITEKEMVGWL